MAGKARRLRRDDHTADQDVEARSSWFYLEAEKDTCGTFANIAMIVVGKARTQPHIVMTISMRRMMKMKRGVTWKLRPGHRRRQGHGSVPPCEDNNESDGQKNQATAYRTDDYTDGQDDVARSYYAEALTAAAMHV